MQSIEFSIADGHLLALFVEERVPAGLSLEETALRALGWIFSNPSAQAPLELSRQAS